MDVCINLDFKGLTYLITDLPSILYKK